MSQSDKLLSDLLGRVERLEKYLTQLAEAQARAHKVIGRIVEGLTYKRDSLIMELGAWEDALGMPRTKPPRSKKEE